MWPRTTDYDIVTKDMFYLYLFISFPCVKFKDIVRPSSKLDGDIGETMIKQRQLKA